MKIIEKIIEAFLTILPFLRKKSAGELKDFSDLIQDQYGFLVDQLDKALKDYFELSDRVKALHEEVIALRRQLAETLPTCCYDRECPDRKV